MWGMSDGSSQNMVFFKSNIALVFATVYLYVSWQAVLIERIFQSEGEE